MNDSAFLVASRQCDEILEAQKIIEDIWSASDDSDVFHDVEPQSFIIPELTTIIGRIDAFDYDPDDLEFVYIALCTKAMTFAVRFRMTGDLDDIDEAISLFKTVAHFPDCDPSPVALWMSTLVRLRYELTHSADDLDRLIKSEEALLRFEDFRTLDRFHGLAWHLLTRFTHKQDVADAERSLSLCDEAFPFLSVNSDDLPKWLQIRSLSILHLSKMGRGFSDIRETFEHLNKAVPVSVVPHAARVLHRFIAEQLKFAALAGDLPQLREIGQILYTELELLIGQTLQILESGRLLLWEQVQSLRTTRIVHTLSTVNHNLFTRWEKATMALKCHLGIVSSSNPSCLGYHSYYAHEERTNPSFQSVENILEYLWDQVAKPVLDKIWETTDSGTKGKARADQRPPPALNERERIWWCCVGEFSFMPIHAAGIYKGEMCTSVSDYFISSYTPTIKALLRARERSLPTGCKVLTVAQPNPGASMIKLPSVKDELQKILEIVPHNNLIPLGNSEKPDPDGKDTTVENVVSKLPDANILHIACHGVQDKKDPLKSGFILADQKRLTVEKILELDLPNAHTAILSACHTASNDPAIPDESINLASALLYAGFCSILGTKWPMTDNNGPLIAEEIYTALFTSQGKELVSIVPMIDRWIQQNPKDWDQIQQLKVESTTSEYKKIVQEKFFNSVFNRLGEGSARSLSLLALPEIIDRIARKLRAQGAPASQWATFIHIGI
ncbi:hypothetical protein NLI96_g11167 [Meripilus lineatus]|uniref:CHAT domain-containing protein n=1 Tax=Meripilus lineatus TaxID=2056292 RepID=A0AAD5YDI7_9APHY|nr:hypothetical protein NLI96_g11167 [Physisporinus lineatus]